MASTPFLTSSSSYSHPHTYKAPVKLEFPRFGGTEGEDPISFVEKCEEYLALRPLSKSDLLATLPSILSHTAKDWWLAEKSKIKNWMSFKTALLRAFLTEDHDVEAEKRLRERRR